jgi:hypothetical protein
MPNVCRFRYFPPIPAICQEFDDKFVEHCHQWIASVPSAPDSARKGNGKLRRSGAGCGGGGAGRGLPAFTSQFFLQTVKRGCEAIPYSRGEFTDSPHWSLAMKRTLALLVLAVAAASALAGCVVVPAGGCYYHPHYYHPYYGG